jgi:hypothetical protein
MAKRKRRANRPIRKAKRDIKKALNLAGSVIDAGEGIGSKLLPEVYPGGKGLDRITPGTLTAGTINPTTIKAGVLDFNALNKFLAPSVKEAQFLANDTRNKYDYLLNLRKQKLGGLDATENQALKESLFRDIDRQRTGALRDVARSGRAGVGAGASFAQRRALGRDYGDQAVGANRQLLLDNINIKRQALGDLEGTTKERAGLLGDSLSRVSDLRKLQADARGRVDETNINNAFAADKFNAVNRLTADQFNTSNNLVAGQFNIGNKIDADKFNAGQQATELGVRVGATSTGAGLTQDERDRLGASEKLDKLLKFFKRQEEDNFARLQGLL